jgi:hypothetical protein
MRLVHRNMNATMRRMAIALGMVCFAWSMSLAQSAAPPSTPPYPADPAAGLNSTGVRIPTAKPDPDMQLDVPEPGSKDHSELSGRAAAQPAGTTTAGVRRSGTRPAGNVITVGTTLQIRVTQALSSGNALNGMALYGVLEAPVRTKTGVVLKVGTRVLGTVVSSARAGTIQSSGVLSVQLTHVGPAAVITNVLSFNGKPGHRDLPDSAPAKGGEARVDAGAQLQFQVMETGNVPGIVPGIAPAKNAGQAKTGAKTGSTGNVRNQSSPGKLPSDQTAAPQATEGVAAPTAATPSGQPK